MQCPLCLQPVQVVGNFTVCPEHGTVQVVCLPRPETSRLDQPWDLESLPALVAMLLAEYLDESSGREPKLKLWSACDVVEQLLRFIVMIAFADLERSGALPRDVLEEVSERIARPTMGRWWGIAEVLARRLLVAGAVIPELPSYVLDDLGPFLTGGGTQPTPETSFSSLRNQLAHGGGVTRA